MVSNLDDNVGRILNELEMSGEMQNTIIWFVSDNGGYSESYFGHASDGQLRVITNNSKFEPMVMLKHFGPNNPEVPMEVKN